MLEWLTYAATGVTFGSGAASAHGILSGYRLAKKVDLVSNRLEMLDGQIVGLERSLKKIDRRLYSTMEQSVWVEGSNKLIQPNKKLLLDNLIDDGRSNLISDLYVEAPNGFRQGFSENPENFLVGVQELRGGTPDFAFLRDDTLTPWHFKENGVDMIGFVKKGYLQSYLGIEFVPTITGWRAENLFSNPYTGEKMSRNAPCFCKSGKKYKHCCGSLSAV